MDEKVNKLMKWYASDCTISINELIKHAMLETRKATLLEAAKVAENMYADVSELGACTFIATKLRQLASIIQ